MARLLLGLLLVAVTLMAAGAAAPGSATLGVLPLDADLLYVQAALGVDTATLARHAEAAGFEVVGEPREDGLRVRVPADAAPAAVARRLAASGLVRSVEADVVVSAAREPVDALYAPRQASYLDVVRAAEGWERQTGEGIVVAVVDTGVDYNHPDLRERIAYNTADRFMDGRDDDGSGCPDDIAGCNFVTLATADPSCNYRDAPPNWRASDDEGHGTFVAGLIAAQGDNGIGIAGIAFDARILPVKVLDCTATGRISDAAAGIRYAARMGADVINISFGTSTPSPVLEEAVAFARAQGALIVASAGNDGRRGVTYPARYADVVAVAASGLARLDGLDYRATAPFANFGSAVDVLAPGVDLVSTVPARLCGRNGWECLPDGPYALGSGSSFATPVVSGALALILAEHASLSREFAVGLLLATLQPGATVVDVGVLDVAAALAVRIFTSAAPGTSRAAPGDVPPGPAPNQ